MSPKWVPQFKDSAEVFEAIDKPDSISYPVLVPNIKGFEAAVSIKKWNVFGTPNTIRKKIFQVACGVKEIAVFAAASESFSRKNINCSVSESIERFREVTDAAKKANIKVRGYVSTVVGCPYEGPVKPVAVAMVVEQLFKLGCYEISLGDTIGVGTVRSISSMLNEVKKVADTEQLAIHCHNTYGQALPNILTALNAGINVVDAAVSGLGGCPYAKGATGNVSTEDVVYMLHGLGANTGIDLIQLMLAGRYISKHLGKSSESKIAQVYGDMEPVKKPTSCCQAQAKTS